MQLSQRMILDSMQTTSETVQFKDHQHVIQGKTDVSADIQ